MCVCGGECGRYLVNLRILRRYVIKHGHIVYLNRGVAGLVVCSLQVLEVLTTHLPGYCLKFIKF